MFKKILLALAVALPLGAMAQKIGVVEADQIMQLMPETKSAQDALAASSKVFEDEFGKLNTEIDNKYAEFQGLAADTPASIKERRQQEIQDLAQRIQAFQQNAQNELAKQQQQLMQPIQEKLINAIKAVGAEQGLTMILPDGVAIYTGGDVIDVTPAVKAKLGIK